MKELPIQEVRLPLLQKTGVELFVKREDQIHPLISGNKFRKLKYNLQEAQALGYKRLLTFGGAFSNHIAATACAGHESGMETIGIIRGEELEGGWQNNPTLVQAAAHGMQFQFVSRSRFRAKNEPSFLSELERQWGAFYTLPEGGTNALAVKGCAEMVGERELGFDVLCVPVGTGGTVAGLINASAKHQEVIGFSALKGDFLIKDIRKFVHKDNWILQQDYHFGGYAKISRELVAFINNFYCETGIPLDPVYTGKMLYGILDMVKQGAFEMGTHILAIHTGGLQGIQGMNDRLKQKKWPLITVWEDE